MHSWIEFLIAKKWNVLTLIITLVVGVLLYIYDKKNNSKAARILNLCQMILINIINLMKCCEFSFSCSCCSSCCKRKKSKDAEKMKIKKDAKTLLNSMTKEINLLQNLKSSKDDELRELFASIQDKNEERQNFYKKVVIIEIKKNKDKKNKDK